MNFVYEEITVPLKAKVWLTIRAITDIFRMRYEGERFIQGVRHWGFCKRIRVPSWCCYERLWERNYGIAYETDDRVYVLYYRIWFTPFPHWRDHPRFEGYINGRTSPA